MKSTLSSTYWERTLFPKTTSLYYRTLHPFWRIAETRAPPPPLTSYTMKHLINPSAHTGLSHRPMAFASHLLYLTWSSSTTYPPYRSPTFPFTSKTIKPSVTSAHGYLTLQHTMISQPQRPGHRMLQIWMPSETELIRSADLANNTLGLRIISKP